MSNEQNEVHYVIPAGEEVQRGEDTPKRSSTYEAACMLLYIVGMSVYSFHIAAIGPTLPNLARNVDYEPTDPKFAIIFVVNGVLQIVAGPFSGLAIDYLDSHLVMSAAVIVQATCLFVIPTIRTLPVMLATFGVSALFLNFLRTGIFTLSCQLDPRHTTSNLLILAVAFGLTNFSVPKAADWCEFHLWKDRLMVYRAWSCLAALLGLGLLCIKVPRLGDKHKKKAKLKNAPNTTVRQASVLKWEAWCVAGCAAVQFVGVGVEQGMGTWLYTYALELAELDTFQASNITSLYWGLFCGVRIVVAILGFWVSLTPASAILMLIPFGLLGSILPLTSSRPPLPLLAISSVLIGIGNSTGFPNSIAMLAIYCSPSGFANGILGAVSGLANSLIPALVSLGVNKTSFHWQWLYVLITLLLALHFPLVWVTEYVGHRLVRLKEEGERESGEPTVSGMEEDLERPLVPREECHEIE